MIFETHAHYEDSRFSNDRDEVLKSLAQQGIGNSLNTDTAFPIVQSKAVAGIVVAAFMNQPPRSAILLIVHHRDGVMGRRFHSASVKPPKK